MWLAMLGPIFMGFLGLNYLLSGKIMIYSLPTMQGGWVRPLGAIMLLIALALALSTLTRPVNSNMTNDLWLNTSVCVVTVVVLSTIGVILARVNKPTSPPEPPVEH